MSKTYVLVNIRASAPSIPLYQAIEFYNGHTWEREEDNIKYDYYVVDLESSDVNEPKRQVKLRVEKRSDMTLSFTAFKERKEAKEELSGILELELEKVKQQNMQAEWQTLDGYEEKAVVGGAELRITGEDVGAWWEILAL